MNFERPVLGCVDTQLFHMPPPKFCRLLAEIQKNSRIQQIDRVLLEAQKLCRNTASVGCRFMKICPQKMHQEVHHTFSSSSFSGGEPALQFPSSQGRPGAGCSGSSQRCAAAVGGRRVNGFFFFRGLVANFWQNFGKVLLVFGCIGADLCKKIRVLQHFSKSTRLSS